MSFLRVHVTARKLNELEGKPEKTRIPDALVETPMSRGNLSRKSVLRGANIPSVTIASTSAKSGSVRPCHRHQRRALCGGLLPLRRHPYKKATAGIRAATAQRINGNTIASRRGERGKKAKERKRVTADSLRRRR